MTRAEKQVVEHSPETSFAASRTRKVRDPRPVGVIDIGSNSVRLVVYSGTARTPLPIFNEKTTCALGSKLHSTGKLSPEGVELALPALGRFAEIARRLDVKRLDVVATSAVRDAEDGADFVTRVKEQAGLDVQVLSGDGEARSAASGVLCAIPDAHGLVADLGGGSLELAQVVHGKIGKCITLPLGILRLKEVAGEDIVAALEYANKLLEGVPWLREAADARFYAVGGAWRAVARVCIEQRQHPLHVLDNYRMDAREADDMFSAIGGLSQASLSRISSVPRKRVATLNLAALLLQQVLSVSQASQIIFSVYGMREGQFFRGLSRAQADRHPVIAAAEDIAATAGNSPELVAELYDWMAPLFEGETDREARLRQAACLIGDAFWQEHPDYRAEQAFLRVLRLPFMGLEHEDRALLALSVFHRYRGQVQDESAKMAARLIDEQSVFRAVGIGLALRLGLPLSGGAPGIVGATRLSVQGEDLVLSMAKGDPVFAIGPMERRLKRLSEHFGLCSRMDYV